MLKYNSFRLNENLSDAKDLLIKRSLLIEKRKKMLKYLLDNGFQINSLYSKNIFELSNLCFVNYLSKKQGFNKEELEAEIAVANTFTAIKKLNKKLEISAVEFSKRENATNDDKKELRQFIFTKKENEETEEQAIKDIEKNQEFVNLRNKLIEDGAERSIGFFTRLLFSDISTKEKEIDFDAGQSYKMVMNVYNDIKSKEVAPYIGELPDASGRRKEDGSPFELQDYVGIKDGALEKLMDDILLLKSYVNSRKFFISRLSKRFREEFTTSSPAVKDKVKIITKEFLEFGIDDNGVINAEENKKLQNRFFADQAGDTNLDGLLRRANNYIKTLNNKNMSRFIKKLAEANDKFGEASGVKIVYPGEQENPKPNILIIEVKSFLVNQYLNTATTHCIAKWENHWDSYISDSNGNKQYYIYNFGLDPDDSRSIIGATIEPSGKLRPSGCYDRFNSEFNSKLVGYMSDLGIPFSILKPITETERNERLFKLEASRGVIMENLPTKTLKEFLDRGADPNYKSGIPLINAVKESNINNVELLLSRGANPNIGNALMYVNGENSWKIAKILIENDPSADPSVDNNRLLINAVKQDEYEIAKYLLYHGSDPNSNSPIDYCKNIEMIRLLVENRARVSAKNFEAVITNYKDLKYLLEHGANPQIDKSEPLILAIKKIENEDEAIRVIDLLIKHGADIIDGNVRAFRTCILNYKVKILKYLLDKVKPMFEEIRKTPKKAKFGTKSWFGNLYFFTDSSDLTIQQINYLKNFLEEYSGYDLKEFL